MVTLPRNAIYRLNKPAMDFERSMAEDTWTIMQGTLS